MTAISAPRTLTRTTSFERTLLRAASTLDHIVEVRLERRSSTAHRAAVDAQSSFAARRRSAEARGAIGLLPR
jgi:Mg-chelatase subunit ChlD